MQHPTDHTAPVPVCQDQHIHPDRLQQVRQLLPDDDRLYDLSEVFRVFGDSTRIRILYALFESELCVCDIAQLLGLTQSAVSHQLRILKDAKLVRFRREGKSIFMRWTTTMSEAFLPWVWSIWKKNNLSHQYKKERKTMKRPMRSK